MNAARPAGPEEDSATRRPLHTVLVCLLAALGLSLFGIAAPANAATNGTVATDGDRLNTRSGPGTSYPVNGSLASGATVTIVCTATGTPVAGPWGTTSVWDKLSTGVWVADAWIYTGTNSATEPTCGGTTPPSTSGSIRTIFGGWTPGISQEFGRTDFSMANCWMYEYATAYGLPSCSHTGIDYALARGSRLYSPISGTVRTAGGSGYFYDTEATRWTVGKGELKIRLDNGHEIIMGHMASITVSVGQRVSAGTYVGTSGYAAGPHLHLEYRIPDSSTSAGQRIVDPRSRLTS